MKRYELVPRRKTRINKEKNRKAKVREKLQELKEECRQHDIRTGKILWVNPAHPYGILNSPELPFKALEEKIKRHRKNGQK